MVRRLWVLLLGFWAGMAVAAIPPAPPPEPARMLAASDLQADLAVLRRSYEALHPGLYRYRTPAQVDTAWSELAQAWSRDQTLPQAYLALSRFTAYLQCGHTYPNFYNQGDAVRAAVLEAPRLPVEFRWLDGRMVVTRSYANDPRLVPGSEIVSIDGVAAADILAALMPYVRADGSNDAKRVANLEVQGLDRYEAFDVYYPLVFPRTPDAPFVLVVRPASGGATERVVVTPIAPGAREARAGAPRDDTNPWQTRSLGPGIAYLRMQTWALYDSKWDWGAWIDGYFRDLVASGSRDLVIDLRGNEGGLSIGDRLLAHLTARDLPADPIERRTRYRTVPADLRPYLSTWDDSFYDWGNDAVDLGGGWYRLTRYDDDEAGPVVKPIAPHYTGRVWVLVGAMNSSATFEFAEAIARNRLGTPVGQTTGGNQRGITGGAFFFMTLPNSGIEVDVPLIGQFPVSATPLPDAGLEPHVRVTPTAADIATGRDVELDMVLALIRGGHG